MTTVQRGWRTAFGNAIGSSVADSMSRGVDWSQAPDQGDAETARLTRQNSELRDAEYLQQSDAILNRKAADAWTATREQQWIDQDDAILRRKAFDRLEGINGMDAQSDTWVAANGPGKVGRRVFGVPQSANQSRASAWSGRSGEDGPVWHIGTSSGRNAPSPLSGMQRAKAHALGVYEAGAGAVEASGYSFGVAGTPEGRAAWAQHAAKAGVEGIRGLVNDLSGTISGWWGNLSGDDPEAIRQATAQGAGVAMGVGGGVVLGRVQGTPLGRAGRVGSAADALSGLSSNQLAALRNAGLGDAEIALQIQTLGDVQLFRGTTPGFPGNPVLQQLGITPASTDPLVATVFALEGKAIGGNAVVLAGGLRRFAAGDIDLGNVRASLEREVQVNMQPSQFEAMAPNSIPVDTARQVLSDMRVAKLPPTITSSQEATQILGATSRLTPAQIQEFLVRTGIRH